MKKPATSADVPSPRKGMPDTKLSKADFEQRYHAQFYDPAFDPLRKEINQITGIAWDNYQQSRKSPVTKKAGANFANSDYDLSVEWSAARDAIDAAQKQHDDVSLPARILLINGSSRNDHSCPGEMSKSYRMIEIAQDLLETKFDVAVDVLDLSRLSAEYGRNIHPCKACFSTAAPLCHWPCSCYPNHAMGQTQDWMADIYPLWVAAHGVMIVTPVNWYQVSSPIKLMMDRLVCADGGNPDPTLTDGKDAGLAKKQELAGWDYPRVLSDECEPVSVSPTPPGCQSARRPRHSARAAARVVL